MPLRGRVGESTGPMQKLRFAVLRYRWCMPRSIPDSLSNLKPSILPLLSVTSSTVTSATPTSPDPRLPYETAPRLHADLTGLDFTSCYKLFFGTTHSGN